MCKESFQYFRPFSIRLSVLIRGRYETHAMVDALPLILLIKTDFTQKQTFDLILTNVKMQKHQYGLSKIPSIVTNQTNPQITFIS